LTLFNINIKVCFVLNTFYYQLMHITLKNAELLKHSKLDVLITLRFLTLCASVGNKKCSVLLMHGVTMKFLLFCSCLRHLLSEQSTDCIFFPASFIYLFFVKYAHSPPPQKNYWIHHW